MAVRDFRDALSPTSRFTESLFVDRNWRREASETEASGQQVTQYVKGNLVANVYPMSRIDGCIVKAKSASIAQIEDVRNALVDSLRLKRFQDLDSKYIAMHNLDRVDASTSSKMLFADRFILVLEQSLHNNQPYVAITFGPFPVAASN